MFAPRGTGEIFVIPSSRPRPGMPVGPPLQSARKTAGLWRQSGNFVTADGGVYHSSRGVRASSRYGLNMAEIGLFSRNGRGVSPVTHSSRPAVHPLRAGRCGNRRFDQPKAVAIRPGYRSQEWGQGEIGKCAKMVTIMGPQKSRGGSMPTRRTMPRSAGTAEAIWARHLPPFARNCALAAGDERTGDERTSASLLALRQESR